MAYRRSIRARRCTLEPLESRQLLAAQPVISEFMASNSATLRDGDGNSSDWIEIYNAGDEPANLAGYRLTDTRDELARWTFPSVTLSPREYRIVYASGQETDTYLDSQGNIHTNFRLGADGEYLALVSPAGLVVSQFGRDGGEYPPQLTDVSFGITQARVLVDEDSQVA